MYEHHPCISGIILAMLLTSSYVLSVNSEIYSNAKPYQKFYTDRDPMSDTQAMRHSVSKQA